MLLPALLLPGAGSSWTEMPSPWGWSHMQSHMQDREISTLHNRHSQAEKQSGCSSLGAVWPPCSTAGAGGEAQLRTEGQGPI